jgi:NADH dehydrogenase FAD-containing subunit
MSACEVVLFNRENHMVFHPLLPEVAGASLNPDAVPAPLRQMLSGVRCRTETVRTIDLNRRVVEFDAPRRAYRSAAVRPSRDRARLSIHAARSAGRG